MTGKLMKMRGKGMSGSDKVRIVRSLKRRAALVGHPGFAGVALCQGTNLRGTTPLGCFSSMRTLCLSLKHRLTSI